LALKTFPGEAVDCGGSGGCHRTVSLTECAVDATEVTELVKVELGKTVRAEGLFDFIKGETNMTSGMTGGSEEGNGIAKVIQ
jgi:hypothetical protein